MKVNEQAADRASASAESGIGRREFVVRSMKYGGGVVAASGLGGLIAACGGDKAAAQLGVPGGPAIQRATVKMGIGPYVDHSYWIIGVQNGWFDQVGITLTPAPAGISSQPDTWGPVLVSGGVQVQSASVSHFLPSMKTAPNLRELVWSDIFQGFAFTTQPDLHLKSVSDFVKQGASPAQAIQMALGQLRGKRLLYPPETTMQSFVGTSLAKAGMTTRDLQATVIQDPQQVPLMLTGRADAQVSGVPTRLTLESKGFKVIMSAADLVAAAKPSADSPEQLTVFRDGAATTEGWYEANQDTALRLTSVVFRITDLITRQPKAAAEIQRPFVNQIGGTNLSEADVLRAYETLDPFSSFEQQRPWFEDRSSPHYYEYEIGAYIKFWEKKGQFKKGEVTVDQVALCADVYRRMSELEKKSRAAIDDARKRLRAAGGEKSKTARLVDQAETYYKAFNFLDASRYADAAARKI